jgi:hypothetical protein
MQYAPYEAVKIWASELFACRMDCCCVRVMTPVKIWASELFACRMDCCCVRVMTPVRAPGQVLDSFRALCELFALFRQGVSMCDDSRTCWYLLFASTGRRVDLDQ